MADWIFEGSPQHSSDLHSAVAAARQHWWSTPRYRHQIAAGDRVWVQLTGRDQPGIYYIATVTSAVYENPDHTGDSEYGRWRTDVRFDYRIEPPLLRTELLSDQQLGTFRPFHGFQGSAWPVPPDIASALSQRAAKRLASLAGSPRPLPGPGRARVIWAGDHARRSSGDAPRVRVRSRYRLLVAAM